MGFQRFISREINADSYLPYIRHADETTVINRDRSAFKVIKLEGISFRTSDISGINTLHKQLNHLIQNIADDNLMIYSHIVRTIDNSYFENQFSTEFSKWADGLYKSQLEKKNLYRNDIYITLIANPRGLTGKNISLGLKKARAANIEADNKLLEDLADKVELLVHSLKRYSPKILGLFQHERGFMCSEIASFLRLLITGKNEFVPLVSGTIGSSIYTDRVIFGRETLEIRHPADATYCSMFGIKEYPAQTMPNMLDDLLTAPFQYILSQSFRFIAKPVAMNQMYLKESKMRNSNDPAAHQTDALIDARDDLASGKFVMGEHNLSLMVLNSDMGALRKNTSDAQNLLANSSAVVSREDLGIEAAFWSQLPGNHSIRARTAPITSKNFAALSPFHNYPTGHRHGNHWGDAICKLQSSAGSPFYFNFHVGDLGHTFICGPSGSGKTVVQTFMLSQLEKFNAKCILFDKDRGAEIFVRACDSPYLNFKIGENTGCAPFKKLELTPANEQFLIALVKSMLFSNAHPFSAEDVSRIEKAVNSLNTIQQDLRSIRTLHEFIGIGEGGASDIGARLEKWCHGNRLGWVFDNEEDQIGFNDRLVGFDITDFLDDAEVRNPIMMYLMQRIDGLINGDRIVICIDEFWKALGDPYFVDWIRNRFKVIRKQNGIIIAGTQSIDDVLDSDISSTVIEQCASLIFFKNERIDVKALSEKFGLTKRECEIIRTELSVGQFLIKQNQNSVVCELDLKSQDDLLSVLSGNETNTEIMSQIRKQHPSAKDWLPIFLQERK